MHGCENPPEQSGTMFFKKTDSPSSSSRCLSIASPLGIRTTSPSPLSARTLTGLISRRPYAGHYSCSTSVCAVALLCPEDTVLPGPPQSLVLMIFLDLLPQCYLMSGGRRHGTEVPFQANVHWHLIFTLRCVVSFCTSFSPRSKDNSLMRMESCTNLCIKGCIRKQSDTMSV